MIRKRFPLVILTAAALSLASMAQDAAPAAPSLSSASQTFRITPVRPIAELRAEALKAKPPQQPAPFAAPQLVELNKADTSIRLDIRYATGNNFLGEPLYQQARAFLQSPAAADLIRVSEKLHKKGYGLLVYDAYRPWYRTKIFWEVTPLDKREFVGDPAHGSRHNRGCAVDLTLYDLKSGAAVTMPSGYDEMTLRAYADYPGASLRRNSTGRFYARQWRKKAFCKRRTSGGTTTTRSGRNSKFSTFPLNV